MTDYAEQIRQDQEAALRTVKRVAESLPGFTFSSDRSIMDDEAGQPEAVNFEPALTPNRPS